jgi:hypothetical protein
VVLLTNAYTDHPGRAVFGPACGFRQAVENTTDDILVDLPLFLNQAPCGTTTIAYHKGATSMSFCTSAKPLARFAICLVTGLATSAGAQQPDDQGKKTSSRIEKKTYEFKEAGKEMEYALFVPSNYDKEKKTPLVVALHGLGGNPQQIIRSRGLTD